MLALTPDSFADLLLRLALAVDAVLDEHIFADCAVFLVPDLPFPDADERKLIDLDQLLLLDIHPVLAR